MTRSFRRLSKPLSSKPLLSMSLLSLSLLAGSLCSLPVVARADPSTPTAFHASRLDTIKSRGSLRCGSVLRPGLAMTDGANHWSGLEVRMCQAVAIAVFGTATGHVDYHEYVSEQDFDTARSGADDIAFLSFAEIAAHGLSDKLLPGPPVFVESIGMLVPKDSTANGFAGLRDRGICFIIGTQAENVLEAWFHDHKIEFQPFPFQEDGELVDTFNVQRCHGLVGETTYLANARRDTGINNLKSRFLPDPLTSFPIIAATPAKGDAAWGAIVSWTIYTILNADAHETDYHASGLSEMKVEGAGLGLPKDWQKTVVDQIGPYSSIFSKMLGEASPLKLERGLNRRVVDGGSLATPLQE